MKKLLMSLTLVVGVVALTLGAVFVPKNTTTTVSATTVNSMSLFNFTGINSVQANNILLASRANINNSPAFRLFPTVDTHSPDVTSLANLYWRIVDISFSYITFWATTPYRDSEFRSLNGVHQDYANSRLRTNLLNDWIVMTNRLDGINRHVVPHAGVQNDRIWIPSEEEVRNGGTWGFGGNSQRMTNPHAFRTTSWLRSAEEFEMTDGTPSTRARTVGNSGSISSTTLTGPTWTSAVRPALNISIASLEAATEGVGGIDGGSGGNQNDNSTTNNDSASGWMISIAVIGGIIVLLFVANLANLGRRNRRMRGGQ